jgi:hypothetical protein
VHNRDGEDNDPLWYKWVQYHEGEALVSDSLVLIVITFRLHILLKPGLELI